MIVLTDIETFGIVFLCVLGLLAVMGIAMLILKVKHQSALRKLKRLLDDGKAGLIDIIEQGSPGGLEGLDPDTFVDMHRDLLRSGLAYFKQQGLEGATAVDVTVAYYDELFRAYATAAWPRSADELSADTADRARALLDTTP